MPDTDSRTHEAQWVAIIFHLNPARQGFGLLGTS